MAIDFKTNLKPTLFGVGIGAVGLAILALSTGWAVTGNTALTMAEERERTAVIAALTPICVAQFRAQGDDVQSVKLAALAKESGWKQDDFVVDQGWATMPGSGTPATDIAEACAAELLKNAKS